MPVFTLNAFIVLKLWILLIFQMVRHGGCLGLGLAAMGTARQGNNCLETKSDTHFVVSSTFIDYQFSWILLFNHSKSGSILVGWGGVG